MLPQEHRLRHKKDIQTLFAKGKSVFGLYVGIKIRPNQLGVSRFTVVVGTKISKKAVVRNRLRRQIRGVLEKYLLAIKTGFDFVFLPKRETIGKKTGELEKEIIFLLKKTRML